MRNTQWGTPRRRVQTNALSICLFACASVLLVDSAHGNLAKAIYAAAPKIEARPTPQSAPAISAKSPAESLRPTLRPLPSPRQPTQQTSPRAVDAAAAAPNQKNAPVVGGEALPLPAAAPLGVGGGAIASPVLQNAPGGLGAVGVPVPDTAAAPVLQNAGGAAVPLPSAAPLGVGDGAEAAHVLQNAPGGVVAGVPVPETAASPAPQTAGGSAVGPVAAPLVGGSGAQGLQEAIFEGLNEAPAEVTKLVREPHPSSQVRGMQERKIFSQPHTPNERPGL